MKVISVKFKESGRAYYFDPEELEIKEGEFVIVETARGVECGEVVRSAHEIASGSFPREIKPVIRLADGVDVRRMRQNRADEKATFELCEKRIAAHKLQMKLVDAEYTLDRSKLVFYFTADNRVDFRELVKDLAGQFHTRIELRQIGVRDESKISGACGSLMCCLAYEQKSYEYLNSITPQPGSVVRTPDGEGTVLEANVVAGTLKVRSNVESLAPKIYKRSECTYLRGGRRAPVEPDPDHT